jgi:hypothetical protein
MNAENSVLALIAVVLAAVYYGCFEAITSAVTHFTDTPLSVATKLGIAIAIPALYLLVFGRGINLGTVTEVEQ